MTRNQVEMVEMVQDTTNEWFLYPEWDGQEINGPFKTRKEAFVFMKGNYPRADFEISAQ